MNGMPASALTVTHTRHKVSAIKKVKKVKKNCGKLLGNRKILGGKRYKIEVKIGGYRKIGVCSVK